MFSEKQVFQFSLLSVRDLLRLSVFIELCLRFEPQIRSTKFTMNFVSSLPRLKGMFIFAGNYLIIF